MYWWNVTKNPVLVSENYCTINSCMFSRKKPSFIDSFRCFLLQVISNIFTGHLHQIHVQLVCLVKHCILYFIFKTVEWFYFEWHSATHIIQSQEKSEESLKLTVHYMHGAHQMSLLTLLWFHKLRWHCH